MQRTTGMWVNEAQRERIFEMIGTHTVTYHRVRNARLEFQRRVAMGVLLGGALLWVVVRVA
ncbi:MAG: hypothetical protein IT361_03960 [Gemmatimonadaceae bacterium]|nr:hypothetical protein [Gemmatimonadaceae bacterium]